MLFLRVPAKAGTRLNRESLLVLPMPLYVVATPIGNLGDLTERAREVLAACDGVVAEDTRHSGNLLRHLGIHKPLHALPAFDEAARVEPLVRRLAAGESLALITDAGTPAVSDPGAVLVRRAVETGVPIVPVPGASAAIAAVSVSGFPEGRFHFAGFLPRKASHRAQMLDELRSLRAQLVFYESPQRLSQTLADLQIFPGRPPGAGRPRADQAARRAGARHALVAPDPLRRRGARRGGNRRPWSRRPACGRSRGAGGGDPRTPRARRTAQGDRGCALDRALPARGVPARARVEEADPLSSSVFSAQPEFLHLHLQALARDLEQLGGAGDVAAGLVEAADDQLALDRLHLLADDLLERARSWERRRRRRGVFPDQGAAAQRGRQVRERGSPRSPRTGSCARARSRARGCCPARRGPRARRARRRRCR